MALPYVNQNHAVFPVTENTTDLYGIDNHGSFYRVESPNRTGALEIKVLGVNIGASMGRIDCALVHYRQESPTTPLQLELLHYDQLPIPTSIQTTILHIVHETSSNPSIRPHMNVTIGHLVSAAIKTFCKSHNITNASIDLIGTRNRTAWCSPVLEHVKTRLNDCSSEEIIIATETGITTVTNLNRLADQNGTGHGESVVALNGDVLLKHPTNFRACQNIGPVATLSFVLPACKDMTNTAMDSYCGVGTMIIDATMRYYTLGQLQNDNDGHWGARGIVNQYVVDRFLDNNKYINNLTAQTTGRESLADTEAQALIEECLFLGMSKYDTIATITRITARNIIKQYRAIMPKYLAANHRIDEIVICGPGARNPNIVTYLRSDLSETTIRITDDVGATGLSASEEAVSLAQHALDAILAAYAVVEPSQRSEMNTATAKIAPGKCWPQLVEQVMRFGEGKPLPIPQRVYVDKVSKARASLEECKL